LYALLTNSAQRSPIMIAGALVLPPISVGMIEASATRGRSTPRTRVPRLHARVDEGEREWIGRAHVGDVVEHVHRHPN